VDELYDRRVNLIASAMSKPETLYSGTRMDARFQRTASRLKEFQSIKYINEPHRP
jgi:cell division protein ZapE